jgi:thiol-disulfide isomerase/thioredoxin
MKTLTTLVLGLIISTGLFAQGIQFEHSTFEEALAKAKAENKMVFMDCYTEWCGPCKALAKNVFPKKEVGDYYNANFVNLKMDMEKGEGPELLKRYKIKGFPTLLFMDHTGKVLFKRVGGGSAEDLIADAKLAIDPNERLEAIQAKYEAGDRSKVLVGKYIALLQKNYMKEELKKVGDEFLKGISNEDLLQPQVFKAFSAVGADFESEKFQYVYKNKDKFKAAIGEETVDQFLFMAYYKYLPELAQGNDTKKLDNAVANFKKEFADSPYVGMADRVYGSHYLANKQFDKWLAFTEKNFKAAEERGKEQLASTYIRTAYDVASNPIFADAPGMYDKAIAWVKAAKEINADAKGADQFLAMLYQKKGDKTNAMKYLKLYKESKASFSEREQQQFSMLKKEIEGMN